MSNGEKHPRVPVHRAGTTEILRELPVEACLFLKYIRVCLHVLMWSACMQKKVSGTVVTAMRVLGTESSSALIAGQSLQPLSLPQWF